MANERKTRNARNANNETDRERVKFEVFGEEMVEKVVKLSGNSGRVYLPPDWVGSRVKIIRIADNGEKIDISQANVTSGKYPYQQTMYFYTKGAPEGNVKKFVDFIQGEKGKAIIFDAGFFLAEG